MTKEKLYRPKGAEATCPKCNNGNAMLHDRHGSVYRGNDGRWQEAYKCRDCGHVVIDPEFIEEAICSVCEEPIEADDETVECDCCTETVHVECGGKGSFVGIETWGCNNCKKYD